jgi:hypothetical protein
VFDDVSISFLERAYARTYGVAIGRASFLSSHRATGKRAGQSLSTLWIIGALMDEGRGSMALPGVRRLLRAAYRSSALRGYSLAYVNPVHPTEWLLERVEQAIPRHTEQFMMLYEAGAEGLEDWNLDTGRLLATERDHPGTRQAFESLTRLLAEVRGGPAGESPAPSRPAVPGTSAPRPVEA